VNWKTFFMLKKAHIQNNLLYYHMVNILTSKQHLKLINYLARIWIRIAILEAFHVQRHFLCNQDILNTRSYLSIYKMLLCLIAKYITYKYKHKFTKYTHICTKKLYHLWYLSLKENPDVKWVYVVMDILWECQEKKNTYMYLKIITCPY
jgi:hypothetical protein